MRATLILMAVLAPVAQAAAEARAMIALPPLPAEWRTDPDGTEWRADPDGAARYPAQPAGQAATAAAPAAAPRLEAPAPHLSGYADAPRRPAPPPRLADQAIEVVERSSLSRPSQVHRPVDPGRALALRAGQTMRGQAISTASAETRRVTQAGRTAPAAPAPRNASATSSNAPAGGGLSEMFRQDRPAAPHLAIRRDRAGRVIDALYVAADGRPGTPSESCLFAINQTLASGRLAPWAPPMCDVSAIREF